MNRCYPLIVTLLLSSILAHNQLAGAAEEAGKVPAQTIKKQPVKQVIPLDHTGELVGDPEIATSGFIDIDESEELVDEAVDLVAGSLRSTSKALEDDYVSARVREVLGPFLLKETGRRPMIVTLPIEV